MNDDLGKGPRRPMPPPVVVESPETQLDRCFNWGLGHALLIIFGLTLVASGVAWCCKALGWLP